MTLARLIYILYVLARHRLDRALPSRALPRWAALLLLPLRLFPRPSQHVAVSARIALERLGPVFVKFGQVLSTRRDLFEEETWAELQKLQDQVPPFAGSEARRLVEEAIGARFAADFRDFSETPLASASVAQIHTATLKTESGDREVVIKVIRPDIHKAIRADLRVMRLVARLVQRFHPDADRLHPLEIVEDYDRTIMAELDLGKEAANTMRLRENWLGSGQLYVPEVFPEYGRENLLVMERVHGVTATDIEALRRHKVNLKKLAHLGVEIFFTQVFEDNFFHADMHPGNVLVDPSDPENPTYIALDCAIIGSLTERDKSYLARNLIAFFNRDYLEVANLHIQSGWVPKDTDPQEFAAVIGAVCDPVFRKPIKEISFGQVLLSLFRTARQFDMEVQPQLVLLQKTLINIEGMGRQIYPDLDLWQTAAPFMERFMASRVGVAGLMRRLAANAPRWMEQLPDLPDLALGAMQEMHRLGERTHAQNELLAEMKVALDRQNKRHRYSRLGGAALIAALFSLLVPVVGNANDLATYLPGTLLGGLGVYWMYVHS